MTTSFKALRERLPATIAAAWLSAPAAGLAAVSAENCEVQVDADETAAAVAVDGDIHLLVTNAEASASVHVMAASNSVFRICDGGTFALSPELAVAVVKHDSPSRADEQLETTPEMRDIVQLTKREASEVAFRVFAKRNRKPVYSRLAERHPELFLPLSGFADFETEIGNGLMNWTPPAKEPPKPRREPPRCGADGLSETWFELKDAVRGDWLAAEFESPVAGRFEVATGRPDGGGAVRQGRVETSEDWRTLHRDVARHGVLRLRMLRSRNVRLASRFKHPPCLVDARRPGTPFPSFTTHSFDVKP